MHTCCLVWLVWDGQVIVVLTGVDPEGNVVEQRSNSAAFLDFSPSLRLAPGTNNMQFDTAGGVPTPVIGFSNVCVGVVVGTCLGCRLLLKLVPH